MDKTGDMVDVRTCVVKKASPKTEKPIYKVFPKASAAFVTQCLSIPVGHFEENLICSMICSIDNMFNADKLSSQMVPIQVPYHICAFGAAFFPRGASPLLCSASLLSRLPPKTSQCDETGFQELSWVHVAPPFPEKQWQWQWLKCLSWGASRLLPLPPPVCVGPETPPGRHRLMCCL